jgi:hypothetical protein
LLLFHCVQSQYSIDPLYCLFFSKEIPLKNKQNFSGEIIRSSDLKDVSILKDKTVVFIGLGETASDLIYALF